MQWKDEGYGITERSLAFWRENKVRLGRIVRAELRDFRTTQYPLVITDAHGNQILLSGCAGGYGGEGPGGTLKVLQDAGFTDADVVAATGGAITSLRELVRARHAFVLTRVETK